MKMTKEELRERRAILARDNRKFPADRMVVIPAKDWPRDSVPRDGVWRSRDFLVQGFLEDNMVRLSVNRTALTRTGEWQDGITWDELQWIKTACGFGAQDAVEVFPPVKDEVRAANMRHLWIFPIGYRLPFLWRDGQRSGHRLGCAAMAITDGVHNS
jgi:hypothetical protein